MRTVQPFANHASAPLVFRAERFLSGLLAGSRWAPKNPGATILVYHNLSPLSDKASLGDDSVTVQDFECQLRFLRIHNYCLIPLRELVSLIEAGREPDPKTVVITFDDGYHGVFRHALPIMKAYEVPATVFLAAGYIGLSGQFPWLKREAGRFRAENLQPLTWEEVAALAGAGIEIGSHSFSHRFLPLLSKKEVRDEVLRSQAVIAEKTGTLPRWFALPFSFPVRHRAWPRFPEILAESLQEGGYRSCCTMVRGHVTGSADPYQLRRLAVTRHDDLISFDSKVTGCYAWTSPLQAFHQHTFKKYRIHPE